MTISKTTLLLISGFAAGIGLCMFFTCHHDPVIDKKIIAPSVLAKKAAQEENHFQLAIDSLKHRATSLQTELASTSDLLGKSKKKNAILQRQLLAIAERDPDPGDTLSYYTNCDSLKDNLKIWTSANDEKDSLYETVIGNQQEQLQIKDSAIALLDQRYTGINKLFKESLSQQELLFTQNKQLNKTLKRQRFKNKLLSGFAVIAAGITTSYLLKH